MFLLPSLPPSSLPPSLPPSLLPPSLSVSSEEEWQGILSTLGLDSVQIRDARYDHIVHMVTAAIGAESFYQITNNEIRKETKELARERDAGAAQVGLGDCSYHKP